jgi:hypothetical protein
MNNNIKKSKNFNTAFSMVEISIVILIIGLLIAGISKASDMIIDSKVKTSRSLTKGSPVPRLSNLVLWIETTTSESWSDRERGGPTLTKTGAILKDINPQVTANDLFTFSAVSIEYKEDAYNSLPSFKLAADSSSGERPSNRVFDMEKGGGYTIFAVVKPKASNKIISYDLATSAATDGYGLTLEYDADSKAKLTYPATSSTDATITADAATTISGKGIEVITISSNVSDSKVFSNGTGTSSATDYYVAGYDGLFKIYSGIEIFEIIVVGEWLSDPLRQRVEQYLFKKWNIPSDKLVAGTF